MSIDQTQHQVGAKRNVVKCAQITLKINAYHTHTLYRKTTLNIEYTLRQPWVRRSRWHNCTLFSRDQTAPGVGLAHATGHTSEGAVLGTRRKNMRPADAP